jgi:hypothetical protein
MAPSMEHKPALKPEPMDLRLAIRPRTQLYPARRSR